MNSNTIKVSSGVDVNIHSL